VETEAIILIQTRQIAIIILVQDVIMGIVVAIVQVHAQAHIQTGIQTRRRSKQRHGGTIVTRVHLQHSLLQVAVLLMEVLLLAVHRLVEVHQVVVVEVEVQDKINKTLTRKILSNSNLRGFFRL
jgi:hypothetical protein